MATILILFVVVGLVSISMLCPFAFGVFWLTMMIVVNNSHQLLDKETSVIASGCVRCEERKKNTHFAMNSVHGQRHSIDAPFECCVLYGWVEIVDPNAILPSTFDPNILCVCTNK